MGSDFGSFLGNVRSIGLVSFLLSTPIGIVAALTATPDPFSSPAARMTWTFIGLAGQVALGAVLLLGNALLRNRTQSRAGSRWSVIAVTMTAGAARGLAVAVLASLLGEPTTASMPVRVLSSAVVFALWLNIIGAALAANDRHLAEVKGLLDELVTRELQLRLLDEGRSKDALTETGERISQSMLPVTQAIALDAQPINYALTARLVQQAIEERLRPLSHDLWFSPEPQLRAPHPTWDFIRRVWSTPVPWRRAVPVMATLIVLNSLVRWGWPVGLLSALVASALMAVIVVVCTRLGTSRRSLWNSVMYLLLLLVPAPAAISIVEFATDQQQRASVNFAMSLGIPVALLLGAAASTALSDRRAMLQSLRGRISESTWDAHLGQLHRRSVERDAATFLHNTVQSRMTAAALQLQLAKATSDQLRADAAIADLREAVAQASTGVSSIAPVDPRTRFAEITAAWRGFADIVVDLPTVLVPASCWRIAADVAEECVANAVRHGQATRVSVIGRDAVDGIELSITDNGTGMDSTSAHGLGRAWISGVATATWTAAESGGGTRVDLRIPHPPADADSG